MAKAVDGAGMENNWRNAGVEDVWGGVARQLVFAGMTAGADVMQDNW